MAGETDEDVTGYHASFPPGCMTDQGYELSYWRMRLRWTLIKRVVDLELLESRWLVTDA